jgi:hypothetical protein
LSSARSSAWLASAIGQTQPTNGWAQPAERVELLARERPVSRRLTAPTSDGRLIINVWQDAERVAAFAALPEMQAAQATAELPPPSSFQHYPGAHLDVYQDC